MKKDKIILLDIDGVLNGNTPIINIICKFLRLINLSDLARDLRDKDLYTIHERKVFLLSIITDITGAKVILTGDNRDRVYTNITFPSIKSPNRRIRRINNLIRKYNIDVIGIVPHTTRDEKYLNVLQWISGNECRISKFIIFDSDYVDMKRLFGDKFILTSNIDPNHRGIKFRWNYRCGIRINHVIKAIKILKRKGDKL